MKVLALIPARMGSSRFPGKPLAAINGKPMIQHVYESVQSSGALFHTYVATCDREIYDFVQSHNGRAVMTSPSHERASDRCAEALVALESMNNLTYDIVVMVQGDEPMVTADMIDASLVPLLENPSIDVVNLYSPITLSEASNPNVIKVVMDSKLNALYFSRQVIPWHSETQHSDFYKQVCIIPFRRNALLDYVSLAPTPLEILESIDMLRLLENGMHVRMALSPSNTHAVDVLGDISIVENLLSQQV